MKRKPKRPRRMTVEQTKRLKKVIAVLRGDYGEEARHALYDFYRWLVCGKRRVEGEPATRVAIGRAADPTTE